MSIVAQMRTQLKDSMKARDAVRTNFLRYWIAQLTTGSGEEVADEQAIKKMRAMLKEARGGQTSFSPEEVALIEEWVPPTLDRSQIGLELAPVADQIKAAPKDGQAMGIAMKSLAGKPVEADDVKAVIAELRG
ncbi:GatB/YqeY domain-containing protein [Tautonia marina]|uniref:GatB/YqeY domain-containing protein n=1 Tax=Tautonia marina TaxID=2653855 RepID=UPI001260A4B4|nr:GatB/YqeY domain-containing protein [Tautonia marina]